MSAEAVLSADGTRIGYRRYGTGPALVLLQGAIGTTESYHDLALELATDFTVYVPERRGRPLSPRAYTPDQSVKQKIEDVEAMLDRSGAQFLFGLSSGAVIALEAARVLPRIRKAILYEPPFYVPPRQMPLHLVARLNREIEAGRLAAGMASALLASGLAPWPLKVLPRFLLDRLLTVVLRLQARFVRPGEVPLRDVVPSVRYDFGVVSAMQNRFDGFRAVAGEVLLLVTEDAKPFFREAAFTLGAVLPHSRQHVLADLDHSGPWNADRGGKPAVVAEAVREFLLTPS